MAAADADAVSLCNSETTSVADSLDSCGSSASRLSQASVSNIGDLADFEDVRVMCICVFVYRCVCCDVGREIEVSVFVPSC